MKILDIFISGGESQKRRKSCVFLYLLPVMLVIFGIAGAPAHAQYPFLLLDFSNDNVESQTESGFTSFTIGDSGSEIDGITVEITGSLDARWRWAPTGISYELIYRDFIFGRGEMEITLSGLDPDETYEITIYAYDTASSAGGDRIADWTANGEVCLTTSFIGGADPTDEDDYAFTGTAQSDSDGTILLECGPNEGTTDSTGQTNPYAFVNALVVSSMTPVNKARRPDPEDGAIVTANAIELQWTPGYTSVSANVYVGESYDDVNNATTEDTDIFRGNTDGVSFPIGSAGNPYPDGLTEGQTYYWRVDEVEADGAANKGSVWSFTVAPKTAFNPTPVDGTMYIDPNITLSWVPGADAVEYHVYFGDNLEDVQAGTGGTDKGTVTDPNYYPGLLELETTYYWRVDSSDGTSTYTGDIWSYTTTLENLGIVTMEVWEDITGSAVTDLTGNENYPSNPTRIEELSSFDTGESVIGSGYGARIHGWLYVPITGDYTFYFTCSNQGELWLSTDDDPSNGQLLASESVWGSYNSFSHITDPISLVAGEKYYIMAIWKHGENWEHCQVAWEGPGIREREIIHGSYISPFLPESSYGSVPQDGEADLQTNLVLKWSSGIYAQSYNVYLGTSMDDINNVNADNLADYPNVICAGVSESAYEPDLLDFNTTYYWRVDDVNAAVPDMPYRSKIWSFTTSNYLVIDNFEAYNDINEGEEGCNRIYLTWSDGYSNPSVNGSTIGYPDPDFANDEHFVEATTVNGGSQSGPFLYNNTTAGYSEVSLSSSYISTGQNWDQKGISTLSLWFYGDPNNPEPSDEQLYIKLNDSKVVYDGDMAGLMAGVWTQWQIDLDEFGIDLSNVTQLTVGMEGGTEGMLFLDDIRLYAASDGTADASKIVYVDATDGQVGNTTLATGEVLSADDPGTAGSGEDGLWRKRAYSNGSTIFEAGGSWESDLNTEDCPRLMTTVNVAEDNYDVYVYFWADTAQWRIRASLENLEGDLPLYIANDPNSEATSAVAEDFSEPVPLLSEDNRTLWQAYLGTTGSTSSITVYIDDEAAHMTGNSRTWYDGIGYKAVLAED